MAAGAPVDEAGLAHVEVADDNHLGEVKPVRNVAVLLSSMVTRASLHTQALPSLRSPPMRTGDRLPAETLWDVCPHPRPSDGGRAGEPVFVLGTLLSLGMHPDHTGPKFLGEN